VKKMAVIATAKDTVMVATKADLTAAVIEAVMDQIIAKNILLTTGGALVSKRDIKLVDTSTDDLYEVLVA